MPLLLGRKTGDVAITILFGKDGARSTKAGHMARNMRASYVRVSERSLVHLQIERMFFKVQARHRLFQMVWFPKSR